MQQQPPKAQDFLATQQQNHPNQQPQSNRLSRLYFAIPQAKPLLPKTYIDSTKPKTLIQQVNIHQQPLQLIKASLSAQNSQKSMLIRRQSIAQSQSSLWKQFVLSDRFHCVYSKFFKGTNRQWLALSAKKMRRQFKKMNGNRQNLFATYVLDMNFLTQSSAYFLKTIDSYNLSQDQQEMKVSQQNIMFDSHFQCGNLMYAFQPQELLPNPIMNYVQSNQTRHFYLVLQHDVNTKGFANWFYFKITSKKQSTIRLHIVNLQKAFSFFSHGMRPIVFSMKKHKEKGQGWMHQGSQIVYQRNNFTKDSDVGTHYSTLSFTLDLQSDNVVYLASYLPYSYSRLKIFLQSIHKIARTNNNIYYRKQSLANSLSSNQCPLLTLTMKRDKRRQQPKLKKKIIIIIARQHPCQTPSSFVMQGLLTQLIQSGIIAMQLLQRYIFKIVPMVNIDGVLHGNSRCDIAGSDSNRKWTRNQNSLLYPIIDAIKKLVHNLIIQGYEIQYFIDLHGHSRKLGSFIYACRSGDQIQSKMFCWFMSQINPFFIFQQCRYGISPFRRQTARGYINNLLSNRKSMTLQTSLYGYKTGTTTRPFLVQDYQSIGKSLVKALHIDTFRNSSQINWSTFRNDIKIAVERSSRKEDDQKSGSDSDPQGDQIAGKQKEIFISPFTASKMGVNQIHVVTRNTKDKQGSSRSPQMNLREVTQQSQGMVSNMDNQLHQKYLQSQILPKKQIKSPQKGLRQTRSVTRIQPFKFKTMTKSSSLQKRIRIAIQIQKIQPKQQRLSQATLPVLQKRDSKAFWKSLSQEYVNVLKEKGVGRLKGSLLTKQCF